MAANAGVAGKDDDNVLLTAMGLGCQRGERLLFQDLSFVVRARGALLIEGANGSGKTTLLRCLAGLFEQQEGVVRWSEVGRLYQGHRPGIRDALTALDNLAWLCTLEGLSPARADLLRALATWGLAGFEDAICGQLSEGQKKRVALARLALSPAHVWLLDEPFSAIDVAGVARLTRMLDEHLDDGGALVLTSHQPLVLRGRLDRVVL